ncbi:saccharopine dehydrogenase NADP-binding domain-containing protein [Myxococcus sp. 1LA]
MTDRAGDILVVGGYGQVGREVVRILAPAFPGRVVVAGRSEARAASLARRAGEGTRARALDVTASDAVAHLAGVALVVMCLDQQTPSFVEHCLRLGIDYVDVTASQASLSAFERLAPIAAQSGSSAVLSVGVAPGLTQVLAARAVSSLDSVEQLDLFVLLGAATPTARRPSSGRWRTSLLRSTSTGGDNSTVSTGLRTANGFTSRGTRGHAVPGASTSRTSAPPRGPCPFPPCRPGCASTHLC